MIFCNLRLRVRISLVIEKDIGHIHLVLPGCYVEGSVTVLKLECKLCLNLIMMA